uniref:HORMA domain-containing protein n=1 Tax=Terrapene triunguis TaxID=2587831 RepID=A0A674I0M0_9SAUR
MNRTGNYQVIHPLSSTPRPDLSHSSKAFRSGWATLFPREIKTHQQSLVMVKRIMAVAVSSITYLRGIFPEDAYSTHYLEGTKIMISKSCFLCVCISVSLISIKCSLIITDTTIKESCLPFNMIESYQFKFRYTSKGPQMDVFSNKKTNLRNDATEDIKRTCLLLIHNLYFLMENIISLPNDVSLTMKLFYYADGKSSYSTFCP